MLAVQDESCLRMIKRALIKNERAGVPSEMLFMTLYACASADPVMEAVPAAYGSSDRSVTIQALGTADLLADLVTPRTVGRSFQKPVGLRKFTRRELSPSGGPEDQERQEGAGKFILDITKYHSVRFRASEDPVISQQHHYHYMHRERDEHDDGKW